MTYERPHDLVALLLAVTRARSRVDRERTRGRLRGAATSEQRLLLAALEAYAAALTTHGHPMPYRMRSELAMYRAMCDSTRRPFR